MALVALGVATWYFGVKRPDDIETAALVKERAANSFTIPSLNADMVWIAPGSFLMGTPEQNVVVKLFYAAREKLTKQPNLAGGYDNERPATWVTLTLPFWLGRTPVTQGQYEQVMGINPSYFKTASRDAPVEMVSWFDAMAFCQKVTELERAAGNLPIGYVYTLPTEAQWEYACRAGTTSAYAGDMDAIAWYKRNSGGKTQPVATKNPNAWGLFDMEGNVCEWCSDWYSDTLAGREMLNPIGPKTGDYRVLRGSPWSGITLSLRSAFRFDLQPDYSAWMFGFRLALCPTIARGSGHDS